MVTQIDFFGIMKEEITRFDFKKTYCFDLDTWLEMIARALRFGETIKCNPKFLSQSMKVLLGYSLATKEQKFWKKFRN